VVAPSVVVVGDVAAPVVAVAAAPVVGLLRFMFRFFF